MTLDVQFAGAIESKKEDYIELPMSIRIESDNYTFPENCTAVFPNYTDSEF